MIDYNILFICLTFIVVFFLHTRSVLARKNDSQSTSFTPAPTVNDEATAAAINSAGNDGDGSDGEPTSADGRKKEKIDFENLSKLTDDDLLNEFNKIETRGKTPHSIGIVEKKQRLALEIHRRERTKTKTTDKGQEE